MFRKISYLIDYFKYIKNPIDALKFKFNFSNKCNIKIKNSNYSITLYNVNSLNRLMLLIPNVSNNKLNELLTYIKELDDNHENITINGLHFKNVYYSNFIKNKKHKYPPHIEEFLTDDEWDMVNFKDRHVIDIGGNVGDTALYFAKKGAEVISFEPVKHLYNLGIQNIELNKEYSNKITLINKGVGGKKGIANYKLDSVRLYIDDDETCEMEIITLKDLINDYDFTPDILKMDCEGCEFEVIPNNDLSMFKDIIFEHHAKAAGKDYKPLINKLEKEGFTINTYPVAASRLSFDDIGIIHAFK